MRFGSRYREVWETEGSRNRDFTVFMSLNLVRLSTGNGAIINKNSQTWFLTNFDVKDFWGFFQPLKRISYWKCFHSCGRLEASSLACMTGALWTGLYERYFARSATRARSARRGEEKNKVPVRSALFLLFRTLTPTAWGDVRRTNQNTIHYRAKIVTFLAQASALQEKWGVTTVLPWLRELVLKFTGLNHLILYVDFAKSLFCKIRVLFQFFP